MATDPGGTDPRSADLATRLGAVRERIATACAGAGRAPSDVTLVVVTKTWPADDVRRLAALGVRDVGENRDQEAAAKHAACEGLGLRWHFIGQLQRNKVRSVVGYADVIESVDRPALVTALDAAAAAAGRTVAVLVQASLEPEWWDGGPVPPGRGGVAPAGLLGLAAAVEATSRLRLAGVMAVAPRQADPGVAFARLAQLANLVREAFPAATMISAGMSHDMEEAIAAGATHVRVGSAVLGDRPPLG